MKVKITSLIVLFLLMGTFARGQCNGATFEEKNGIVVIQAESVSLTGAWRKQTSFSGFTGSSYLNWTGQEYFRDPGNGLIQYKVKINSPGTYRFNWRTRIGLGNLTTEHNDTWLRIPDAADFYGQKGSSRVYPRGSGKTPNPEGASSNGWLKIYMNKLSWEWRAATSDFDAHDVYVRFASAGVYTIQISARSRGHLIDRMVLYKESQYSASSAQSLSRAETRCDGSTPPPPPPPPSGENDPPTVNITSPNSGQNFAVGSNVTVNLSANDSDGSISQHQILVNGTVVDNDGSTYSPYVIQNIAGGNYTITARVTDNDGATAQSSVTISAGGGSPPPPPPPSGGNNPPSVSITSPANGQNFAAGSNVSVNLTANDSDGIVEQHNIFVNGSMVDTDGSNYTPYVIQNITNGSYAIRALVTDNDGATAESTVNITVGGSAPPPPPSGGNNSPMVNITSPSQGQNFAVGSNVRVNLSASDSDGTVIQHKIFVNGKLVDTDPSNFTPYVIENIASGSYAIRAVVTDNDGATGESTVNITVGSTSSKSTLSVKATAYPNPVVESSISVKLPQKTTGSMGYQLVSATGKVIDNGVVELKQNSDEVKLDLNGLNLSQSGIYYLLISDGVQQYSIPVVKK
jgi:hypothetical protein